MKFIQIRYLVWYKLRNKFRKLIKFRYNYHRECSNFNLIHFGESLTNRISYFGNKRFVFLNLEKNFETGINWDYSEFGKLWCYNLNYFEFINQDNFEIYASEFRLFFEDFNNQLPTLKNANEPFPTSLRIINWIKYFCKNKINHPVYFKSLYNQLLVLSDNKEYHLLGNHLLENGFALIFGGVFFQKSSFYQQGKYIVLRELEEQILNDGGHFELSPMYHNLILFRLLDVINLFESNVKLINGQFGDQESFVLFLKKKAEKMCGWVNAIAFKDGAIPHFNDSTYDVAPESNKIIEYARRMALNIEVNELQDSGYRRLKNNEFDIIVKTGKIGPDYIPGHAHADSLSFVCNINDKPVIVDPGITTYEKNEIRQNERSTSSHNTLSIGDKNSSNVWGGFRVAQRAKGHIIFNDKYSTEIYHDGYWKKHFRKIVINNKNLTIVDKIQMKKAKAYFHFHPNIKLNLKDDQIFIGENILMSFEGAKNLQIEEYSYSLGFNKTDRASKIIVSFDYRLLSSISIL